MQKIFSMSFNVKTIEVFEKKARKLIRKYPSLKKELQNLIQELKINPNKGIHIGKNCFKIRISISSKGKGKSGGARVITNFVMTEDTIYLLSIYDKSERDSISDKEIKELLSYIPF
jgi:mRNA-degrading endonuclease RelE of RelBE toxin-antitoxin system